MSSALVIIIAVTVLALYLGVRARRGHDMNLEQWTVGGRSFGTAFVFLLMAGEIYTTFTFLGGSGFAYGKGAPVYYILAYGTLAYILSYWMLPPIWRYAKKHRLVSQPHYFARKYDSPALGVLVRPGMSVEATVDTGGVAAAANAPASPQTAGQAERPGK